MFQESVRSLIHAVYQGGEGGSDQSGVMVPLKTNQVGGLKVSMVSGDNSDNEITINNDGSMAVSLQQNGNVVDVGQPADSLSHTGLFGLTTRAIMQAYNGTTYDRWRNNQGITALASAARTASTNSADLVNYNHQGAHFIIDVTSVTDSPSITPTIEGKCPVSGVYYTILTGSSINSVGTTVLKVHPGIAGVANAAANDILPRIFRISVAHADTDSITYSVGVNLVM